MCKNVFLDIYIQINSDGKEGTFRPDLSSQIKNVALKSLLVFVISFSAVFWWSRESKLNPDKKR